MINSTATIKKIHEKFPNLTIDELLQIIDCIIWEYDYGYVPQIYTYPCSTTSPAIDPNRVTWTTTAKA